MEVCLLFIEGTIDYRPGIDAEMLVWNKIKSTLSSEDNIGHLHYPMHKKNHSGKREIDILLVNRELGVSIIEVKGINIKQIDYIQGPIWHYLNYHSKSGDPYNQAEQQLNMLCDHMEKNPVLYRTFSKRAVVALPYITRKEWAERGFDQLLTSPPILFKDDFDQNTWFQKLKSMPIYTARNPINDQKWKAIKKHFYIRENEEEKRVQELPFSNLYVLIDEKQLHDESKNIEQSLKSGVKIYLFTTFRIKMNWLASLQEYIDAFQFQVFHPEKKHNLTEKIVVTDGICNQTWLKRVLVDIFPTFNVGQYVAVHTPQSENLMITAGAGTGKTYVMMDRILYLLEKASISLKDIVMITFTNASTNEMKERLQTKLLSLFRLTGKTKYLFFAEDVKSMQISTIHSFSKTILTELAHEIGFGRNVSLRSFIKTKKDIIEKLTDEYFKQHSIKDIVRLEFPDYEIVNLINSFWEEMEKKGLTRHEIETLDWGEVKDEKYQILHDLFQYVFKRCEAILEAEKKRENAIDMGDLIRKLKLFTQDETKMKQLQGNKFLFVDEFQDSDNTQIELVASLRNQLNSQLFVVGDIKQSIYRFRGADYTSFERLEDRVKQEFAFVPLNQNYRTTSSLLDKLDSVFSVWGQERYGQGKEKQSLLPYTDDDRLRGMEKTTPSTEEFLYPPTSSKKIESDTIEYIRESLEITKNLPEKENKKVALIVRTNRQALDIRNWCEKAKIGTVQNLDGTFYKSHAVLHFKMLLEALLYPHEAKYVINVIQSPYFGYTVPSKLLIPFNGDNEKILRFLKMHMKDDFTGYLDELRLLPVMAVIQKIISEKGVLQNIEVFYKFRIENEESQKVAVKQYEKNLFHLMNIIQLQFDAMNGTLWSIYEWLSLQIRVNRNENEPMIETGKGIVEITNVHRAKGLEYHTVIMPQLSHTFSYERTTFYLQDEKEIEGDEKRKVGWFIKKRSQNDLYDTLNQYETFEIEREETRLLYVAMTRAKKRLILMMPIQVSKNTWGYLLEMSLNEVTYEY
jgi:ATP-dependent exoDNAse (exonuclease V) beta subunit